MAYKEYVWPCASIILFSGITNFSYWYLYILDGCFLMGLLLDYGIGKQADRHSIFKYEISDLVYIFGLNALSLSISFHLVPILSFYS